jgi:leader peptidase (prepilin peptidase) / N-methyltransferase
LDIQERPIARGFRSGQMRGSELLTNEHKVAGTLWWSSSNSRWTGVVHLFGLGILAVAIAGASFLAAPGVPGVLGAGLGLLMAAIAVVDGRHFIIPNSLTLSTLALGLINAALTEGWQGVLPAVLRGAVLALVFLALRGGYQWFRGRPGIGLGDVKLAGAGGVWLGWTMLPLAVEIAALAALAVYAARWLAGRPVRRLTRVPFGMFFAPAIWLAWLIEAALTLS